MNPSTFKPGFRLSTLDIAVLLIGGVAAWVVAIDYWWIGVAIGLVVGHFFLFCNVLRMSRPLELVWAGAFIALAVAATFELLPWVLAFGLSLLVALVVAMIEMRRPSYHGVGWQRLNPRLPAWWNARNA